MAIILRQLESLPETYPDLGDSPAINPAVWARIEAYTAFRWTPREVVWHAEGPGDLRFPLAPAVIDSAEVWHDGAWVESFDHSASPWGGIFLPSVGPFRFVATVGGGEPELPAAVIDAAYRLADYMASTGEAGAKNEAVSLGDISQTLARHEAWQARSMQNSGAADLLRNFRRAP